jgi:nucleotide-binding universal stress UspA family protein
VLEFGTGWSSTAVIRALEDEKEIATTYLASLSLEPTSPDLEIIPEVIPGSSPAQVIADYAAKIGADLIVMTCQGRSGFSQFMVGSQTERTLRLAACSILIVR